MTQKTLSRFLRCFVIFTMLAVFGVAAQDRGLAVTARQFLGDDNFDVGKQYAVIIGIDKYREWNGLRNAVSEAREVRRVLGERYYIDEFFELYDEAATAANIRSLFMKTLPAKLGIRDSLLVFYAGHGYLDASQTGFWIACDGTRDELDQSGWLSNAQLRNLIGNLKSQRTLVLADACFSGDFLNVHRGASPVVDNDYFRKALRLTARQALTSGASEAVPDQSEFGRQLVSLLERNSEPYLDAVTMYDRIRLGVTKTQPLLGTLPGNETGASFVLFLKPLAAKPSPPIVVIPDIASTTQPVSVVPLIPVVPAITAAELFVASVPTEAEVYIDGVLAGLTPNLFSKLAASKPLTIEARKGNQAAKTSVTLSPGESRDLSLSLTMLKGNIFLKAKGAEACLVTIGGRNLGALGAGMFRDLDAGDYQASVRGNGLLWQGTVNVPADRTGTQEITLYEVGSLDIKIPADAQFRVLKSGTVAFSRSGGVTIEDVPVGYYSLEASGAGYDPATGGITVSRGAASRWEPWTTGAITITTEPLGAEIFAAGQSLGRSPVTVRNLATGMIGLSAKLDGYDEATTSVSVPAGKTAAALLKLTKKAAIPSGYVAIPGGTFTMGDTAGGGDSDEKPLREVTVSAFSLAKYETTVDEFRAFINASGYKTSADIRGKSYIWENSTWVEKSGANWANSGFTQAGNEPVVCVSWYDAIAYCNWRSLTEKRTPVYSYEGKGTDYKAWPSGWNTETQNKISGDWAASGYRLPTEAEWEYAAKSGVKNQTSAYSGGANLDELGWYSDNSGMRTKAVGQKKANSFGVYDLSGNVWEWCWDWYGSYGTAVQTDPRGPASGEDRVGRGGGWSIGASSTRASNRLIVYPWGSFSNGGFRLLLPPVRN